MKFLILLGLLLWPLSTSAAIDVYFIKIPCFDEENREAAYECLNPDYAVSKYIGSHTQTIKFELFVDENKWPLYTVAYFIRRDY